MVGDNARKTAERTAEGRRATVAEAARLLPGPGGERCAKVLGHGSMEVELYTPRGADGQTPHSRDKLYVVVSGTGELVNRSERHPFGPGDVLFVVPEARRRGVATVLLEEARGLAVRTRAKGLKFATATDNLAAQRLYESSGWQRDNAFHHYSLSV